MTTRPPSGGLFVWAPVICGRPRRTRILNAAIGFSGLICWLTALPYLATCRRATADFVKWYRLQIPRIQTATMAPSTASPDIVQPVAYPAPSVSGLSTIVSCQRAITASLGLALVDRSPTRGRRFKQINPGVGYPFHSRDAARSSCKSACLRSEAVRRLSSLS